MVYVSTCMHTHPLTRKLRSRTGVFLPAAASLACFGGCYALDIPLTLRCVNDADARHQPRALAQGRSDPCSSLNGWAFECPATRQGLLGVYSCSGPQVGDGEVVDVDSSGARSINT